jgi:signal transduction histidine kinase
MQGQNNSYAATNKFRVLLVGISVVAYIIVSLLLYPANGAAVGSLLILPVVVCGWCFGLRVSLLAGLIFFTANVLILSLITGRSLEDVLRHDALGYVVMILIGIAVSRFHDLGERLKHELNRRLQVEVALRESETRFRTLVEQSPFSTQIFRPDGSVITVNQAFCTLWNASPVEAQYVIENYNILKDEQLEFSGLMPFIKQGFTDRFAEIPAIEYNPQKTEMVKQTGLTTKWVVGYIWPVKDEQGRVLQVVLTHQDITERKQVEAQQLELASERARADLLNELLNTLSHDLKTPLSIINTSLYLLEKTSEPAYQKLKIDNIHEQTRHLNKMIQNLLTASYLETAPDSSMQALDLNVIATQLQQEFSVIAEGRSITLEILLETTLPPVQANEAEFRRVLVNLLENALHYTPSNGRVTLQTFRKANQVVVEVCDTGLGIAEADLAYIFDQFYRADKARTTNHGGTGLGLAIAKKIVERHQGRIEVESKPGQGSSFRIWLPVFSENVTK